VSKLNHEEHEKKLKNKEVRRQESEFRRKNPKSLKSSLLHHSSTPIQNPASRI
jgi:hypothetical protein